MPTRLNRDQQQELTRQRLLDAALGVFRQHGFAAATVDEIAELAGYSRGALYSNFGSKEGLLVELLEQHTPLQLSAFRTTVEGTRSVAGIIKAIVAVTVPAADNARGQSVDIVELASRVIDKPGLSQRLLSIQTQTEELLGWCAGEICRHRGSSLTLPPDEVGLMMAAFLAGLAQRLIIEPGLRIHTLAATGLLSIVVGASSEDADTIADAASTAHAENLDNHATGA